MEEVISAYQTYIRRLNEEYEHIEQCFQGELLHIYRNILEAELEKIKKMLCTLY